VDEEARKSLIAEIREGLPDHVKAMGEDEPEKIRGLGDVVHKVATFLGFSHCSECEKRRQRMNRWTRLSKAIEDE
jgi:hypothetical protein